MSVDEDNELRDLVSQTLESNGILAKIRAELRASVFLALEEQDAFKDKPNLVNKALKEFVSSSEGAIVMCLIREFLEFYGLEFTMAVFDPETQLGQDYEYIGRSKLAKDLKFKTVQKTTPLLVQIVQKACNSDICGDDDNDDDDDDDELSSRTDISAKDDLLKTAEEKIDIKSPSSANNALSGLTKFDNLSSFKNSLSINGSLKPTENVKGQNLENKLSLNDVKLSQIQQNSVPQPNIRKPDTLKLDINPQSIKQVNNSSLSSLGGLPPLAPLANGQVGNNFLGVGKQLFGQKDVSNDIKALLDQGLSDSQDNNYEEDFHSTASDKTKKGQVSASGSEVEEEISSAGDDQTSISVGGDEVTVDTTISQASGHGDYLENI